MDKKRINWIDIAKGISIYFIVLGHTMIKIDYFSYVLYSFNAFIFFFLSGLTFCYDENNISGMYFDKRNFLDFLKKNVKSLIKPYIIWGVLSIIAYKCLGVMIGYKQLNNVNGSYSIINNILGLFYANSSTPYFEWNRPLWFLPCLIVIEMIWYFILYTINKLNKKCVMPFFLTAILVSFIWYCYMSNKGNQIILPFEAETSFSMVWVFGIGLLIRYKLLSCSINFKQLLMIIVITLPINLIINTINGGTDLRVDKYGNPILFAVGAISATVLIVSIAIYIGQKKYLEYIGKKSMWILCVHKFPVVILKLTVFRYLNSNLWSIAFSFLVIVCCLCVDCIIQRFGVKVN